MKKIQHENTAYVCLIQLSDQYQQIFGLSATYEENRDSIRLNQQGKGNLRKTLARNSEVPYYFPYFNSMIRQMLKEAAASGIPYTGTQTVVTHL